MTKTMGYFNKTLHCALDQHENDSLVKRVLASPIKFRTFYRINREKIGKYRSQCAVKCDDRYPLSNISERSNMRNHTPYNTPLTTRRIRSEKQMKQTTRWTQTEWRAKVDVLRRSIDRPILRAESLSLAPLLDVTDFGQTQSSSHSDALSVSIGPGDETQRSVTSSSNTSVLTEVSDKKPNAYLSTPRSTHCRVYLRSIAQHMLSDDASSDE